MPSWFSKSLDSNKVSSEWTNLVYGESIFKRWLRHLNFSELRHSIIYVSLFISNIRLQYIFITWTNHVDEIFFWCYLRWLWASASPKNYWAPAFPLLWGFFAFIDYWVSFPIARFSISTNWASAVHSLLSIKVAFDLNLRSQNKNELRPFRLWACRHILIVGPRNSCHIYNAASVIYNSFG